MPGLSIHVMDVARGVPAKGMRVQVSSLDAAGGIDVEGVVDAAGVAACGDLASRLLPAGRYCVVFHLGDYLRGLAPLPAIPFLERVPFEFGLADPRAHYHLPLKFTPWGFSLFRGGA